jgi:predicted ABC-type ATPase
MRAQTLCLKLRSQRLHTLRKFPCGHDIPEETIRRRFDKSISYFETYKSIVNEWYVWDSVDGGFALMQVWDKR